MSEEIFQIMQELYQKNELTKEEYELYSKELKYPSFNAKFTEDELLALHDAYFKENKIAKIQTYLNKYQDSLSSYRDLVGDTLLPTKAFLLLLKTYGHLLKNDPKQVLSKRSIELRRKITHPLIMNMGPLFLNGKKYVPIFKEELPQNRPLIFVPNHGFLEDAISSVLTAQELSYFVFGSIPQFYNTFNGLASYLNGSILVNRQSKASKEALIPKAVYALNLGVNLIWYPEGVWNKTSNQPLINFWPGLFKAAKKSDALIIPITHILKDNTIYSTRHCAIDSRNYNDDELERFNLDIREVMSSELLKFMLPEDPTYELTKRADFLGSYPNMNAKADAILQERIKTAGVYYDTPIETSCDYRYSTDPLNVWEPIANLDLTKNNYNEVINATKLVKTLKTTDYQRKF